MITYHKDFFINRLVKEWLSHEKIIIGCDLDDTIIPYNEELTDSCHDTVQLIKDCQQEGIIFIANTARESMRLEHSVKQIEKLGIIVHSINGMPLYWDKTIGLSGKIYANIFLDDRGGLECAKHQLRKALEIVKQQREQQQLQNL